MDIERETVMQILLSLVAVGIFIAAAVFVSTSYGTNGHLSAQGGQFLVGVIGLFVALMVAAGLYLERQEY